MQNARGSMFTTTVTRSAERVRVTAECRHAARPRSAWRLSFSVRRVFLVVP
jgi:hypothetical protein